MNKLNSTLLNILRLLPNESKLQFSESNSVSLVLSDGRKLLNIEESEISISGLNYVDNLFKESSPLADSLVPPEQLKSLLSCLTKNNLYKGLNHLGICYRVNSVKEAKRVLIDKVKDSSWHLYEETSNDKSSWLFLGDTKNWQDPLLEIVLVEDTSDKWKDYWLPHIQIDIDTALNGDEIETLVKETFKGIVKPFRLLEIGSSIILVRARLGVISGININLDMGFEGRMVRYHRTKLLTKLV